MLATLANATGEHVEKDFPLTPIGFGLVALVALLALLYVVTRLDPDR
jgi:hypothetical protein